ncbi:MAG: Ribosomal large subunit pseudouridine synthase B [Chlamydiales bacterium]|nr:Ribosomal large subunit pseudouridine synthase B [Chlamydiales bacterium]MCH9635698.1 Ribosomal large subunit pseudouridine synthase B [Chlamydiales bacterium]
MRLSKALAQAGVASRRASEEIIFDGRVSVNGQIATLPQTQVEPERDEICVDGKMLSAEKKVYFLLNKPVGYDCTNKRFSKNSRLVIDLFAHCPQRLFTVGRLDRETTGALIVTNDGDFSQRLIHPSFDQTKEYVARTGQEITADHLARLQEGTRVQGVWITPKSVKKVRRGTVKITVCEGKKHEVRELLKVAGLTVLELKRIRLGPFILGELPIGGFRPLTRAEISQII